MGVEVGLHEDDFFSLRKVDVGRLLENASVIDGGGVPEWSNGAVSKTVVRLRTVGSNPTPTANHLRVEN